AVLRLGGTPAAALRAAADRSGLDERWAAAAAPRAAARGWAPAAGDHARPPPPPPPRLPPRPLLPPRLRPAHRRPNGGRFPPRADALAGSLTQRALTHRTRPGLRPAGPVLVHPMASHAPS